MMLLSYIAVVLMVQYIGLMLLYRKGWKQQEEFMVPEGYTPKTKISIIIPARNEEANIGKCIDAIFQQDYPKDLFEVIVVDDHSRDNTVSIVNRYTNVKCLKLSDYPTDKIIAYKKKALSIGIANSTGELIVTTDADCYMGTYWLKHIAAKYEQDKPIMIVAPVDFTCNNSIVEVFQSLDFMSMQGITVASHQLALGNMSNGANLAFTRKVYDEVDGYAGIDHLASGDDYLLMMKLKKNYPSQIGYLKTKEAIVRTLPQSSWGSFLQQRIRWASKSGKYNDSRLTLILSLVYLVNLSLFLLVVTGNIWVVLELLIAKTVVELCFLYPVAGFFNKRKQLIAFLLLQPLHIAYIVLAGFLGFVGVYKWKGRVVR
jgi:cellulose synthase/poly-beta-1,6-N-acetylglucosamine synthase-like glycosyltransferase